MPNCFYCRKTFEGLQTDRFCTHRCATKFQGLFPKRSAPVQQEEVKRPERSMLEYRLPRESKSETAESLRAKLNQKSVVNRATIAKLLGVNDRRVVRWMDSDILPHTWSKGRRLIKLEDLRSAILAKPKKFWGVSLETLAWLGVPAETIALISDTPRGQQIRVYCVETGETFNSASEASRKYGVAISAIVNAAKGLALTAGGYHWKGSTQLPASDPNLLTVTHVAALLGIGYARVDSWLRDKLLPIQLNGSKRLIRLKDLKRFILDNPHKLWGVDRKILRNLEIPEEVIVSIRQTPKGRWSPVKNLGTGEIFESAAEAARKYQVSPAAIAWASRTQGATSAGYSWARVEEGQHA